MKLSSILSVLLTITFILSIYLTSAEYVVYSQDFYKKEFVKNKVYEKINDADRISKELIGFYKNNNKIPEIFDESEKSHLNDVKDLINKGEILLRMLSLVNILLLSFILFKKENELSKIMILSSISGMIVIIPFIFLNFSGLFNRFHLIFFPQGNWQFSVNSSLIQLFPEAFFYDAAANILIIAAITFIIIMVFGLISSRISSN